jgi:hypothetical protein
MILSRGTYYSALLHGLLIVLFVFGLPHFARDFTPTERVVTLEILPVSKQTNVKSSKPKPKEVAQKPKPKKPEPPKEIAKAKPAPTPPPPPKPETVAKAEPAPKPKETEKAEPAPKPKAEEKPKEKEKPKEVAKPAPPTPEPPKPPVKTVENKPTPPAPVKSKTDDFASVLASMEEISSSIKEEPEPKEEATDEKAIQSTSRFNEDLPLSISEIDAVRRQIEPHWTVLGGARDAEDIAVVLKLSLEKDGSVRDVSVVEKLRYSTDPFYRAAADRALAAVRQASPIKGLPEESYKEWAEMTMTFDPKEMFN